MTESEQSWKNSSVSLIQSVSLSASGSYQISRDYQPEEKADLKEIIIKNTTNQEF
ncbi:hypothetical protein An08g09820 [Aspergillus niger]|uniref:Uncharacterized protein n=2 Tax=Aspergillus niger TaxID=5061 RepID=A5ABC5_ASPNC|nr:hypothetical protein An08g09820 [Aspergillus niger]CAK96759.1 hypothetical protein An08g09820 [Aspergillus niger]